VVGLFLEELIGVHQAHQRGQGLGILGFLDILVNVLLKKHVQVVFEVLNGEILFILLFILNVTKGNDIVDLFY